MRTGIEACDGKPALAVASLAGKHFMPGDAEIERIGIRTVYPQDVLAASVRAMRDALAAYAPREPARSNYSIDG